MPARRNPVKQSTCNRCGQAITWGNTKNGKRAPFNPDGTIHFKTCGKSEEELKARAQRRQLKSHRKRESYELDRELERKISE